MKLRTTSISTIGGTFPFYFTKPLRKGSDGVME